MIPKTIHYCWFGNNPLDNDACRCIDSWKRFFPDYEIKQWNESNFDISAIPFMEQAYKDKKWAFVSDVARLMIIYEHGGLYFDTDVEVIASYDDLLTEKTEGFIGFESTGQIASGLGFGAEKGHPFLKKLISVYHTIDYCEYRDRLSDIACTLITTKLMSENGLIQNNQKQYACGFDIYPAEYFSPIDYHTGKMKKTRNTHSIHWYSASWKTKREKRAYMTIQRLNRLFGERAASDLCGVLSCMRQEGILLYVKKRFLKYLRK